MLARAACLLLLLPAAAGCSDAPAGTTEPRPVLSSPNNPRVASDLTEGDTPQLVSVTFLEGILTGDVGEVPVAAGSLVRLTVVTDVTDTVTVEGYGKTLRTSSGQPVQLELLADEEGSFDVRLDEAGEVLTTLVVG